MIDDYFASTAGKGGLEMDTDRRKHKRYQARADAFAVISPKYKQPCHIIDISKGGLSFCYANGDSWLDDSAELDIYLGDEEICLNKIPDETVADYMLSSIDPGGHLAALNQRSVKFGNLSPRQLCELTYFIEANTREAEELGTI